MKSIHIKGLYGLSMLNSRASIFSSQWDKTTNTLMTRLYDSVGKIADASWSDFDTLKYYKSIHEVTDVLGNVFVRFPKVYIKKIDEAGNKVWQISTKKKDGYYLPSCFWDFTNQKELPYVDIGKHLASLSQDGKLESKPGKKAQVNTNIVDFRSYAKVNGPGYQLYDIHAVDLLQTLFYIEFAQLNSQAIMQGAVSMAYSDSHTITVAETGTNRAIVSNDTAGNFVIGQSISIGTSRGSFSIFGSRKVTNITTYDASNMAIEFEGDPVDLTVGLVVYTAPWETGWSSPLQTGWIEENNGKYPCAYRGIESPWGDCYQWVDGINILDNQAWVCKDADEYASNAFMHPYEQLSYINSNVSGWVEEMGHDPNLPFAEFPIRVGSSAYYGDYYYQSTGARVALMGGYWNFGSYRGLSLWLLSYSSSYAYIYFGARLLRKAL